MSSNKETVTKFEGRVRKFAHAHRLFVPNARYLVALSGGADSVSLLLTMKSLGIEVDAVHCNFHLRGNESVRDENFCIGLCREMGVKLHLTHFDTLEYARLHKKSIEMAARDLRYAYFENLRKDIGAEAVCVAHHQDDSVETVLINLLRGTGINGLKGIVPMNGHIVRPLLCVCRKEITEYLKAKGQAFVTDSTNLVDDVVRNKIRLDVLPLLEKINPSVRKSIFETSVRVGDALHVFNNAMGKAAKDVMPTPDTIDVQSLLAQEAPECVLFEILGKRHFTSAQVNNIFDALETKETGKTWTSSSHEILINRGQILIQQLGKKRTKTMRIPEVGIYVYDDEATIAIEERNIGGDFVVSKKPNVVCVDYDKVHFPLTLRPIEVGDRFVPFGMKRSKLVSDFLTDRKRTLFDKRKQLVVADADGHIVWLVGERVDDRCRITSESSAALILSLRG